MRYPMEDSPVEMRRKELPSGDGCWPGYDSVWSRLQEAALKMSRHPNMYLSEMHIETMAVMGCGDEETIKWHIGLLRTRGWIE